jgi:hypothetical protein
MAGAHSRVKPARPAVAPVSLQLGFRVHRLLLPASMALWVIGVTRTNATQLGPYGLPAELPVLFYVGLALLVLSASIELAQARLSKAAMALHCVALAVVLYGTAAVVYSEGRYSWLYKTIGVVQYINSHGQLNGNIDIYQNWPGFFALAGWFDKVAGVGSPLVYAKWAQLVFELAALPLLYLAYQALSLPPRQCWIAMLLYLACDPIAQDYFSPQGLGTVLGLGVMAFALRWFHAGNGWRGFGRIRRNDPDGTPEPSAAARRPWRITLPLIAVLVLAFFVLTFSHELSPYLVATQLVVLAVAGLLRPRWLPFVLAAVAFGYLLPHLSFVNAHYGLLSSLGHFFSNIVPPSLAAGGPLSAGQEFIERSAEALTVGMWLLALVGAWMRRNSRRTVLTLLILAFSPVIVLAAVPYGNEGILRVYLFSLPWTAALVAAVLSPLPSISRNRIRRVIAEMDSRIHLFGGLRVAVRPAMALTVALVLFFPAFFGDDASNVMTAPEVDAVTTFLEEAKPGPVFLPINNLPISDARYDLFPVDQVFGTLGALGSAQVKPNVAAVLAGMAIRYTGRHTPAYLIITPSMLAYNESFPVTSQRSFVTLRQSLGRSPDWHVILNWNGSVIYEMPADAPSPGPGKTGVPGFAVP